MGDDGWVNGGKVELRLEGLCIYVSASSLRSRPPAML